MAGRIHKTICYLILGLMPVTGGLNIYSQDCSEGRYCLSLIFNQGGSGSSNLTDAENSCRNIGSKLAEIHSSQIQSYVTAFLMKVSSVIASNLTQKDVLVNAQRQKNETWYWINGKPFSDSITLNSSHNVARVFKSNDSYSFESASPTDRIGYICEYPNTSPKSYTCNCTFTDDDGRSCFVVNNASESWFSARNKCLWSNGDLASLDNIMANISFLQSPSASVWFNQKSRYWIGLRKNWWIWQGSKSEVKYTNWSSNIQPFNQSQECITLSYNSPVDQWMTFDCNLTSQFHYLCLYEKRNKTTILTTILTTETVTRESTTHTNSAKNNLALGLGVGLGLCVALLIIVVVVLVVIIIKRRLITSYDPTSQTSSSPANKGKRKPTNDSIPYYTQVAKHKRDGGGTSGENSTAATTAETATASQPQTAYAEVRRNQTPSSPVAHGDNEERQPVYINVDIIQ